MSLLLSTASSELVVAGWYVNREGSGKVGSSCWGIRKVKVRVLNSEKEWKSQVSEGCNFT